MKIMLNRRPIGSVFNNASDARANIVENARTLKVVGLNTWKEVYTDKNGAGTAIAYHNTGRVTVTDSQFSTDEMWSLL